MKKHLLFFFVLLITSSAAYSQYNTSENRIWTFGYRGCVDFSSGIPMPCTNADSTREGIATISGTEGLLFYTNGNTIYNRLHAPMPSGAAMLPPSFLFYGSATQGALIAPTISNPDQYYVFALGSADADRYWLAYTKVDMTLDGGLGDVVPGTAATMLGDSMSEKMVVVRGDNCNLWLVTHHKEAPIFKCYEITAAGIMPPVISHCGTDSSYLRYCLGVMKINNARNKLVLQQFNYGISELYDFDPATGIVSGHRKLDTTLGSNYGAEFSPDGSKLYLNGSFLSAGGGYYLGILQYDLTLPTTAAMVASRIEVGHAGGYDIKLAVDGKMYFISDSFTSAGNATMGRIDNPNALGAACGFVHSFMGLPQHTYTLGLPNVYVNYKVALGNIIGADSVCLGQVITLLDITPGGVWTSTGIHASVGASGIVTGNTLGIDTIVYTINGGTACEQSVKHVVKVYKCSLPVTEVPESNDDYINVSVVPNPSHGTFDILVVTPGQENVPVVITDLLGRKVMDVRIDPQEATQVNLPVQGIYVLHAVYGAKKVTKKIVVE